jgi:flagellar hook-length control protein FliK
MRTDAMLFSPGGGQNDTPRSNRMDRNQNRTANRDSATGFGKDQETKATSRFQETYNEVARSNSYANKSTERNVLNRDESNQSTIRRSVISKQNSDQNVDNKQMNKPVDNRQSCKTDEKSGSRDLSKEPSENVTTADETTYQSEHAQIQDAVAVNSSENQTVSQDSELGQLTDSQLAQASETIKQALIDIAGTLNLNIVSGLENVNFAQPTSETVDQLTQIVHDLKTIIGALEASVAQGEPIDTGKKIIEKGEADDLVVKLNAQLFKVEIGINILGKAEDVQAKLAQMTNTSFASGIPQAIDPSQIAVASEQMKKIFGKALNQSEDSSSLSQLIKKINELVKDSSVSSQQVTITEVSNESTLSKSGVASYDTMIYRAMLKLEKHEKTVAENADALVANTDKASLLNAGPVIARDISVEQVKIEQVVQITEITVKAQQTQQSVVQELRSSHSLPKVIEQSVINQINEKMSNAIRNGVTEVRVQLRPESLGDVTVKIRIEGDVVTAKIQVENQQVKAIVENNFQSLKDSLSQHNIQTGSLEVNVQNGGKDQNGFAEQFVDNHQAHHGRNGSGDSDSDDTTERESTDTQGETGRRFGNNSVEYFA